MRAADLLIRNPATLRLGKLALGMQCWRSRTGLTRTTRGIAIRMARELLVILYGSSIDTGILTIKACAEMRIRSVFFFFLI